MINDLKGYKMEERNEAESAYYIDIYCGWVAR